MISDEEKQFRLNRIKGAYFHHHAKNRALERIGLNEWNPEKYEQKILDDVPDIYWDCKYENYQAVFDELVLPFNLNLHEHRDGLLAYVETALPPQNGFREGSDRFQLLKEGDRQSS